MARINQIYNDSAIQVNGVFIESQIEGYHTLESSGREMLEKQIETIEKYSDGSLPKTRRYPEREIVISYMVEAETSEQMRERLTALAGILDTDEAEIIFNDEPDRFLTGTLSGSVDINKAQGVYSGEFTILCTDPFKYSVATYTVTADAEGLLTVPDYGGTYKAFPTMGAEFASDCGYVGFVTEEGEVIQVGSTDETDYVNYEASETLISDNASALSGWTLNGATLAGTVSQTGSVEVGAVDTSGASIKAQSYGSGSGWHGPAVSASIPADSQSVTGAENFTFSWRQRLAQSKTNGKEKTNEYGQFQAIVSDASNNIIAGVTITKSASGKQATIACHVNNKSQKTVKKSVMYSGKLFGFGRNAVLNSKIIKSGAQISFNVGGWQWSTTVEELESVKATKISFAFLQKGTARVLGYNALYSAKFIKNKVPVYEDVPNKFTAGDVLEIDCASANITLNALDFNAEGALGNDWEKFVLVPGENIIQAVYSDWASTAPTITLSYKERYI